MIDPARYGVSFSVKQCRNFNLDPRATLDWLIAQGWQRFRLMSYWDEHEKQAGQYDFSELDWQIAAVREAKGVISLCLGAKQPRWPEYHWPDWAWQATKVQRDADLLRYIAVVVERYKDNPAILNWQLENEALLSNFGTRIEIDRDRLRREFALVKRLDAGHPIAMSTSNGWGIPVRSPRPDLVGFSYYPIMYKSGGYHRTIQKPWLHQLRKRIITAIFNVPVFIHELQCEPWGPTAIWNMDDSEQNASMDPAQISANLSAAKRIGAYPVDLWGAEWWYWRHCTSDTAIYAAVATAVADAAPAKL